MPEVRHIDRQILGNSQKLWDVAIMQFILFAFFFLSPLTQAAPTEWRKAALIELPMHECLLKPSNPHNTVCVTRSHFQGVTDTYLFETRQAGNSFEKRNLLHLVDSSQSCEGENLNIAQFHQFESRDVDGDGIQDGVILIRAGKMKRKPTKQEPCPHPKIPTAIYEVTFLQKPQSMELNPLSILVLGSLNKLLALEAP